MAGTFFNMLAFKIRCFFWRLGRYLYLNSRGDLSRSPYKNGEYFLVQTVLDFSHSFEVVVVDIGANIGDWTEYIDQIAKLRNLKINAHLFEPANDSYLFLKRRFYGCSNIKINHSAVLNYSGKASLGIAGDLGGTNSISFQYSPDFAISEDVNTIKLDDYDPFSAMATIDLLKIDAEGSDFFVIDGARQLFREGKVQICQFEYNHRWIYSRNFLKDVFNLPWLEQYYIAKLHNKWIEIYGEWHPELEKFFEGNYLIIKKSHPIIAKIGVKINFGTFNTPTTSIGVM